MGDTIYIINSVSHAISAQGWTTNLEITMWNKPISGYNNIEYNQYEMIGPVAPLTPISPDIGFPIVN